jgi:outer membrane PBP1 activator LpoA protein
MQRVIPLLITLFALYACAVPHKPEIEQPVPAPEGVEQPAAPPAGEEGTVQALPGELPATPGEIIPAPPVPPTITPFPHIALLLPLKSPIFGTAADTVQQGFMAAINPKRLILPVRVYSDFDENSSVVAEYRQAIANGAQAVVGPLTRNGVAALAAQPDIPVPTLALNVIDGQFAPNLYFFGLAVEAEARQVAQLAKKQNLHQAIIITSRTQVSQRMQSAFEEEWASQDRGILREIEYNDDPTVFADIANINDTMVFLAVDAVKARMIRPYLPNKLPIYATSQIFVGNDKTLTNYDLNGIHFVDMPWLLQPDHPAVMVYPRPNPPLSADRERLYALGIDAFRLIQLMLSNKINYALPLDGVCGQIQLNGHNFQHTEVQAVFSQGEAQVGDVPAPPTSQIFPGQVVNTQ